MATGWTFAQVGELTLMEYSDLRRYWADHPPLHLMVAAYLGYGKEKKEKPKFTTAEELASSLGQFPELTGRHG